MAIKRVAFLVGIVLLCAPKIPGTAAAKQEEAAGRAAQILEATGVQGGLIVHLGCGDGSLTAALAGERFRVHGIDTDSDGVAKARARLRAGGNYGPVSADVFDGMVAARGRLYICRMDGSVRRLQGE